MLFSYLVGCIFSFDVVELFKIIEDLNRIDFRFNWRIMNDLKNVIELSFDVCFFFQMYIIVMIFINFLLIVIGMIGNVLVVGVVYINLSL